MKTTWLSALSLGFVIALSSVDAQSVSQYAGNDTTLEGRWKWAIVQNRSSNDGKEIWIGYSIKRLMDQDSFIASGSISYGTMESRGSLYALVGGQQSGPALESKSVLPGSEPRIFKRMKDVALLFLVSRSSSGDPIVQDVELCSMDLAVNLKNKLLLWLGASGDVESMQRLKDMFARAPSVKVKKDLVEAIGLHQRNSDTYSLLIDILIGRESDEVRAKAAQWIGELGNPVGLKTLENTAEKDRSVKVREEAVFAISRIDNDESTDVLITLARTADNSKVRGKSAFWLGQKASRKAVATLESIVADDEESDVQRQALYALAQVRDSATVDWLTTIARNHANPRIRKQAIQLLSQSDDPKALETLIEIVRK